MKAGGQTSLDLAGSLEPVITLEHDDWRHLGVFIDRAAGSVHILAVDARGKPTGTGLRFRKERVDAFLLAVKMAKNRLDTGGR